MFARGNDKQAIFADDHDRLRYLAWLEETVRARGWHCLAYCLMGNHVHLLIETTEPNLGRGMQWLHGMYAAWFNRRHRRTGHLFGGRYKSVRVTTDAQLWSVVGYIARNPVEARLCSDPADWQWSSHLGTATGRSPTWLARRRLFELVGAAGGDPLDRYLECVERDSAALPESPHERGRTDWLDDVTPAEAPNRAAETPLPERGRTSGAPRADPAALLAAIRAAAPTSDDDDERRLRLLLASTPTSGDHERRRRRGPPGDLAAALSDARSSAGTAPVA